MGGGGVGMTYCAMEAWAIHLGIQGSGSRFRKRSLNRSLSVKYLTHSKPTHAHSQQQERRMVSQNFPSFRRFSRILPSLLTSLIENQRQRERERECVCVCVNVHVLDAQVAPEPPHVVQQLHLLTHVARVEPLHVRPTNTTQSQAHTPSGQPQVSIVIFFII